MPPSVAQGKARLDETGKLYIQPLIVYTMTANVSYQSLLEMASVEDIQSRYPVSIASSIDFLPPPYQQHVLVEDDSICSTLLRKSYFAPPLAKVELSMQGSDPLRSSSGCRNQHLKRYLHLRWFTKDLPVNSFGRTIVVLTRALLISKTYYGVRKLGPLGCEDPLPHEDNGIQIRTETTKLGTRKCQFASPELEKTTPVALGPQDILLLLPIESEAVIPPTFATPYAARNYTLQVVVSFQGYHHSPLLLEAPIQVNQCFEIRHLGASLSRLRRCDRILNGDAEVIPSNPFS